jgi:hypothetical protein
MNPPNPILPHCPHPAHPYRISGSLPTWDQLPRERQLELIQALAALLISLPKVQALWEVPDEPQ